VPDVDAPLLTPHDLIRPWRRATLVAGGIAAIELVLLLGAGVMLVAKPLSHQIRKEAVAAATTPASRPKKLQQAIRRVTAPPGKARPRSHVKIMVFNGNGRAGAAGTAAGRIHTMGYVIAGATNARRQDYATSVVMYRPGFRAEGIRLAKDLGIKVVGPLDGIGASALHGGQVAVIVGS
jgi:LytR cell envelope-related transcriptional attenuator